MEVVVAVGLLCRHGRLLLGKRSIRRASYPGVWDMPGGHVEAGESPEQALLRELDEELGVLATAWRELAVLRAPAMSEEGAEGIRMHVFVVSAWRGEPRNLQPEEHDAVAWFTRDDLPGLTLAHPGYSALFQDVLGASR